MAKRLLMICVGLLLCGAAPVDWKFIGDNQGGGIELVNFYDATSVRRLPKHHIEVWTKAIDLKVLENLNLDQDGIDAAASNFVRGYRPPYALLHEVDRDQLVDLLAFEQMAKDPTIQPRVQSLWEMDCDRRVGRTISLIMNTHGKMTATDTPTSWIHFPPESIGRDLMILVCQ
jgi:hypothetical protein